MGTSPVFRARTALMCLIVTSLTGCGKDPPPSAPPADTNSALRGTWIGTLTGPRVLQPSLWSPDDRDSIWIVFGNISGLPADSAKFYMTPRPGGSASLSIPADTCFVRYPTANTTLSDPNVAFRVNFSLKLRNSFGQPLDSAVPLVATRSGTTLTGTLTIPGDSLAGTWTATYCASCPYSSAITSIDPASRPVSSGPVTLTVNGTNFSDCSVVRVNGVERNTTFMSSNQLTIMLSVVDQAAVGTKTITVFTSPHDSAPSNGSTFTIQPALSSAR